MVKTPRWRALALGLFVTCLAWLGVARGAAAQPGPQVLDRVPDPRSVNEWVSDNAQLLDSRRAEINQLIDEIERERGVEIAVVVRDSIGGEVPRDFATALFNHWGVGKKEQDNGVLILHVLDQRRVEIEVGYGLEATLTDTRCQWIIDDVTIPFFKEGSFADGHLETVRAVTRLIRDPSLSRAEISGGTQEAPGLNVQTPAPSSSPAPRLTPPANRPRVSDANFFLFGGVAGLVMLYLLLFLWGRKADPYDAWKTYKWGGLLESPSTASIAGGLGLHNGIPMDTELLFLGGAGLFLPLLWRWAILNHFRDKPRDCPDCGRQAERVGEDEDDAFLEAGQVTEEEIGSMDYDVWQCSCGWHRVDPYKKFSSYSDCPGCGYRTYHQVSSRVITPATYDHSGTREVTYECVHCNRRDVRHETIPRKQRSSSSSSSSSSSWSGGSSGGSWGGGSSGGGGAGGSY